MYGIASLFLRLPKLHVLEHLLGLRVQQLAWLSSYSMLSGDFFRHAMSTPMMVLAGRLDASISTDKPSRESLIEARQLCDSVEHLLTGLTNPGAVADEFSVVRATSDAVRVCKLLHPEVTLTLQTACSSKLVLRGSAVHWQEAIGCAVRNAIEAYHSSTTYRPITVVLYQAHNRVRIEVIDYAEGMGRVTRYLVGIPGVSAKPLGKGLGLPFIRFVVEELFSGSVEIESTPQRGTRMRWVISTQQQ